MSKLSFRARALDATKPMPVYEAEEIPDLPDFAAINRAVPQMPTGMEKEEETEHHLQRALSAQQVYGTAEALVIPVPEIEIIGDRYTKCYAPKTGEFKPPKQFVHVQPFGMDQEIPDYDMDSEDETWMNKQARKMEISATQFENMMDRLEKGSGQQVVTLQEAKLLLKEDDDLIIAVYDYWLNKRLRTQHALIPTVRTEKRDGSTSNNPYVAFRRRTEKMQTRKNRKNDEASYEKMLKLRRDLNKALTILELVKRREKSKKELLQLTIEVVDQRYQMGDFNGQCLQEAQAQRHKIPSFIQIQNQLANRDWTNREEGTYVRKKREYKKRKYKQQNNTQQTVQPVPPVSSYQEVDILHGDIFSSDDDALSPTLSPSDHESDDPDGHYAFRRKANCHYQAPILDGLGNWPWCGREDGGFADKKYRYSLASLSSPRKCIGFARRRVGRGGRVLVDRGFTPWDDDFENIDLSSSSPGPSRLADLIAHIKQNRVVHFRPKSPTEVSGETIGGPNSESGSSSGLLSEFNLESFQNHQEQLLQMQRHQQQQLLQQQTELDASSHLHHSFSSLPTSHFTLDSAKAQFAASALLNSATADLHVLPSVPATVPTATTPAALTTVVTATTGATSSSVPSAVMTNGPKTQNKSSGFSTSPAATVLELNFPLPTATSSTKLDHVSVVTAVQSLSTTTTVTSKNNCQPSNTVMKLGTSANNHKHSSLAIDNHEETPQVNSLVADTGVAMEVT